MGPQAPTASSHSSRGHNQGRNGPASGVPRGRDSTGADLSQNDYGIKAFLSFVQAMGEGGRPPPKSLSCLLAKGHARPLQARRAKLQAPLSRSGVGTSRYANVFPSPHTKLERKIPYS